jgi:hypothetical protein
MTQAMRLALATSPGTPGWPNEDFAAIAPGAAVLLDGATTFPIGRDTGCQHGVAWYARTLGTTLLAEITAEPAVPLTQALAGAIADVRARHVRTCDLTDPATPAATVTALRHSPDSIEYLALSDSTVAIDYAHQDPVTITSTHQPAKAGPTVASGATAGTIPATGLRGVALLSDGATRICDRYALLSWPGALKVIWDDGPDALISQIRAAEDSDRDHTRWPRNKSSDDATIVYWHLD